MLDMKFNIEPEVEPNYKMTDYSSTYLGYHFIFWKEEDPEDFKHMMDNPPHVDEEMLTRLENECAFLSECLLSEAELEKAPSDDYIYRPVATAGFTGEETKPEWLIEFDDPSVDIEEEVLVCARSRAPKRPGETRDIGIMKPSSMHFHRRFMYPLKVACSKIKGCPYGRGPDYLRRIVSNMGHSCKFFYMRDYTKSGMTIPHPVQDAILKGFFRRCPEMYKKCRRFFSSQQLFIKDDIGNYGLHRPTTGSPLGMFVEGYTIFQYALHNINCEDLGVPENKFKFTATNDDMVVGCKDKDLIETYLDVDCTNNSLLGMQYKDTKSGISEGKFVYCEEYWIRDHIDPKSCLWSTTMIGGKYAATPFHAKAYCYALMITAPVLTEAVNKALHEVQSHVGYEFHEEEFSWPYRFGGWLPQIKEGLDHSIEWYDGDLKAQAGYWANTVSLRRKGTLGDKPHLSIGRKYDIQLIKEPEDPKSWLDLVPLLGTKRALEQHYHTGVSKPSDIMKEYMLLFKVRKNTYNKFLMGQVDKPYLYTDYIQRYPDTYIPSNFPGIQTTESYTRITGPRLSSTTNDFEVKLQMASEAGYILCKNTGYVSKEMVYLASQGIVEPFLYEYLPVSRDGVSHAILKSHYQGYLRYYEETGRVITSLYDGDSPYKYTKLWAHMPWASLHTTLRMWNIGASKGHDMHSLTYLVFYASVHRRISDIKNPANEESEEESSESGFDEEPRNEGKTLISEFIYDVIRDWDPNPSETIASIQHRIVPVTDRASAELIASRLAFWTQSDVSLLPQSREEGDNNPEDGDVSDDSSFFDPWAELGV
jgi:hypothetical protein